MERLIDPTLADIQAEYQDAVDRGGTWESRWIRIRGHVAFVNVVVVHGGTCAMRILHDSTVEDRRALTRTVGVSTVIMIVGTLLLTAVPFLRLVPRGHPDSAELALYLIPAGLPLAIPLGLTLGILWVLGRVIASPRSRALVLLAALLSSVVSFTMLGWVVPTANQAFRVSITGRPVVKGTNELTLRELDRLLAAATREPVAISAPTDVSSLALNYHTRWALAGAPLVLALFALALTRRSQLRRLALVLAGGITAGSYYVAIYAARDLGLPAYATAWVPNAGFLALSVALMKLRSSQPDRSVSA
jgi:lipopolysaccharide export LptBFGC system permease protein LptF